MNPSTTPPAYETYQEKTAPVQSFVSAAVAVLPNTLIEPRKGRPAKNAANEMAVPALATINE